MATLMIPTPVRLQQREESYGDLQHVFSSATNELAEGNLHNAWACFNEALCQGVRIKFVEHSGKGDSPITDPDELIKKLQSACILDRWMCKVLQEARRRPQAISHQHVDIFGSIVHAVGFD